LQSSENDERSANIDPELTVDEGKSFVGYQPLQVQMVGGFKCRRSGRKT
jgi:hypothetical protein